MRAQGAVHVRYSSDSASGVKEARRNTAPKTSSLRCGDDLRLIVFSGSPPPFLPCGTRTPTLVCAEADRGSEESKGIPIRRIDGSWRRITDSPLPPQRAKFSAGRRASAYTEEREDGGLGPYLTVRLKHGASARHRTHRCKSAGTRRTLEGRKQGATRRREPS